MRPFLSGRDYHSLHHENAACRQEAATADGLVIWRPYADVPAVISRSNGRYDHRPDWYRGFLYTAERERGLDDVEDLYTPGELIFDLSRAEAVWRLEAQTGDSPTVAADPVALVERARADARDARAAFASPLARAADAYLVQRGAGRTIVAGYPWFTDWGRDTFIALRGLTLTTGRVDAARDILLEWSGAVSEGMLPNRFPDAGDAPEFNSVDASLWFIVAVEALFDAVAREGRTLAPGDRDRLRAAVHAIVEGYARGTRFGIRMDADGLLACGVPGSQLTWMDARVGDWTVTPRVGKPVEVQALWLNALRVAGVDSPVWRRIHADARAAVRRTLLECRRRMPVRRRRRRSCAGPGRRHVPPEPDLRRGRPAGVAARRRIGPDAWSRRSSAVCGRRSDCGRWRPASPATPRTTKARPSRVTAPITRGRSGRG